MSISSVPAPAHEDSEVDTTTETTSGTDKPSSGPRAISQNPQNGERHDTSERRGLEMPGKQLNRRLFDKIASLIHRYSNDPLKKNENGDFEVPDEKVLSLLQGEIEELKRLDPLIPILLELRSNYADVSIERGRLQVVAYKVISPSIKELNDVYLGPNQTDDYVDDLHRAISDELEVHNAKQIHTQFKGGVLFVDHGPTNGHTPEERASLMQAHESRVKDIAKRILLQHLKKRHEDLYLRISDYSLNAINENQRQLRDLIHKIDNDEMPIEIAFGFENIPPNRNPVEVLSATLNAEREANMIALDRKYSKGSEQTDGPRKPRKYEHHHLLTELIAASLDLYHVILDEDGQLKPEWNQFFDQDKDGKVMMRKTMIQKFRKIDQYRESEEYRTLTTTQQKSFEERLKAFSKYYERINIIDVLKKFTAENTEQYIERIRKIVSFIEGTEGLLKTTNPDQEVLRYALSRASNELEVSLKDEGEKTVHTTRAEIKALMAGQVAVMVFGDNIGFAGLNQSAYENSAQNLMDLLGFSPEELLETIMTDEKGQRTVNKDLLSIKVQEKLKAVEDTTEFKQLLLSVGDEGTKYLRKNQHEIATVFNGKPAANADGGDEDEVTYTKANGCKIPEDPLQIERALFQVSRAINIRIAAVYGDMSFTPMADYKQEEGVSQTTRREILRLLRAKQFAEVGHRRIKAASHLYVEMKSAKEIDKMMT